MTEMFRGVAPSIKRFDFSLPYDNLEDFLGRLIVTGRRPTALNSLNSV